RAALGLGLLAGVVLLAVDRGFLPRQRAVPALPGTAGTQLLTRAQAWFGTSAWLDATAPLGLGLLASAYTLAVLRIALHARPGLWLETLLLVTPLWLTSTRLQVSSAASAHRARDRAA